MTKSHSHPAPAPAFGTPASAEGSRQRRATRSARSWSAATLVAAGSMAMLAAACSSSSSQPTTGHGSPAQAAAGFIEGLTSSTPSNACNFVQPKFQTTCKSLIGTVKFTASGFAVGNTFTASGGTRALVTVLVSNACVSTTNAPTTSTCISNSNVNADLPSSDAGFNAAFNATFNTQIGKTVACENVGGSWYVAFQASGGIGTSGATGTTGQPGGTGQTGTGTT